MRALASVPPVSFFAPLRIRGALGVLLLPLVAACGQGDGTVTVSGDVAGLDSLGFLGDTLLAQAGRLSLGIDTPVVLVGGDSVVVPRPTPPPDPNSRAARAAAMVAGAMPGENPMSRRAVARGDSMARAAAMRLVGGVDAAGRSRGDSLRGVVTLVGNPPAVQAKLRLPGGAMIALSGMATTGLARLAGADILVRGVKVSPRDVVVADYVVRAMNGVPAYDGKLESGADGWALQLTDGSGRKRLASVPASLQSAAGARVWVAVPDGSSAPAAFGLVGRR